MSYLVLARKYRPRNFTEMVGQEHVVQALGNALETQRLHHAYLFTGTRGVGKTTVSRILAKSLNCVGVDGQGGITSRPCGVCQACTDIDSGRFVDYTELDAASNRGVDEVQSLLEQAVYKPVQGRFKVFMIDEVHMLTNTAFNAMLKTLEEPPEYLKFVLATTDPQKVPVTVLSRCLQFNLRPMAPETVLEHLTQVLGKESVPAEEGALRLLSRAARGSMRDALSLTDQAIAFGSGQLLEAGVRQMLGSVDRSHVFRLIGALAEGDGRTVVETTEALRLNGLSAASTLEEMTAVLQRMAVFQAVPQMAAAAEGRDAEVVEMARLSLLMPPDETQLLYSMCLHGRAELGLAPDEYAALTMVLLRLLAFKTAHGGPKSPSVLTAAAALAEKKTLNPEPAPAAAVPVPSAPVAAMPPPVVAPAPVAVTAAPATPARAAPAEAVAAPATAAPVSPAAPEAAVMAAPAAPVGTSVAVAPEASPTAPAAPTRAPTPTPVAPWEAAPVQAPVATTAARAPSAVTPPAPPAASAVQAPETPAAPQAQPDARPAPAPVASESSAAEADDDRWGDVLPDAGPQVDEDDGPPDWAQEWPDDGSVVSTPVAVPGRALPVRDPQAPVPPAGAVRPAGDAPQLMAVPVRVQPEPGERTAQRYDVHAASRIDPTYTDTEDGRFWHEVVQRLAAAEAITALVRELALQSQLVSRTEALWTLRVERDSLNQPNSRERLRQALQQAGLTQQIAVEIGPVTDSPARRNAAAAAARQKLAEDVILSDPFVQTLMRDFGAKIVPGTLKPA
ncbi:DNA polymerase III subunit gamma/tau [Curvibacter sp. HBC61]|uniref:DNA polymerase III subunit gamma/tau n=1 Tax=Curvibacter cyanobacteriorum TaxID=3026422 RepID=A0ABT5MUU8_9BURK|nr:DNA polymerase III subunit gamma/tau [Curvibacter sp. HBC61]MDD0837826.1 DNA polymerase III subunit gamma/tau [Curvibacter sp. HBC61]